MTHLKLCPVASLSEPTCQDEIEAAYSRMVLYKLVQAHRLKKVWIGSQWEDQSIKKKYPLRMIFSASSNVKKEIRSSSETFLKLPNKDTMAISTRSCPEGTLRYRQLSHTISQLIPFPRYIRL
jgi:hypothetical protein